MTIESAAPVDELEAQFRANQLKMNLKVQEAQMLNLDRALSLDVSRRNLGSAGGKDVQEGLYSPQDYVDIMDYRRENYGYQAYAATFTTKTDRQDGRNWPYWVSEPELAAIRGTVRLLVAFNKVCFGVVNKLRNYTISKGLTRKVVSKKDAPKDLITMMEFVLDEFDRVNNIKGGSESMECEACIRDIRDGEVGLSLWHRGEGHIDLRTVEPDQISEPTNKNALEDWLHPENDQDAGLPFASNWSFGVHSTKGDVFNQHGYYVQWDGDWQNWDYLPGGNHPCYPPSTGKNTWLEFRKRNTDRVIKRGVSDFWSVSGDVELARKMIRNLAHAGALQAAIAWIREMAPGTTASQVQSATMSTADWQTSVETANGGSRQINQQTYLPGSTLYMGANQKFVPPPWANSGMAAGLVQIFNSMLMSISQIWSMPEHMITGSASNSNYASILEAGSPFVKEVELRQMGQINLWLAVYWKVVWFNWKVGRFGKQYRWSDIKKAADILLTGAQIDVRDRLKETQKNLLLFNAGLFSPVETCSREGVDYKEQVEQGAKKQMPTPPGQGGGQPGEGGQPGHMGSGLSAFSPELGLARHTTESEDVVEAWTDEAREAAIAARLAKAKSAGVEVHKPHEMKEGHSYWVSKNGDHTLHSPGLDHADMADKFLGKEGSSQSEAFKGMQKLGYARAGIVDNGAVWVSKFSSEKQKQNMIDAAMKMRRPLETDSKDGYDVKTIYHPDQGVKKERGENYHSPLKDFLESENPIGQGWIGVDLDGTLAQSSEPCDVNTIGVPIPAMVEKVKQALLDGKDVKIFTARMSGDPKFVWAQHQLIRQWCLKNLGQVLDVTNQKDKDMVELWDDRARAVKKNEGTFESENTLVDASGTRWKDYP